MSMTVVSTRNVPDRVRGFLASSMLELAPGVYSASRLSPAVRDRIWSVLRDWCGLATELSVVMVWADSAQLGGQAVRVIGVPPVDLIELDGLVVTKRTAPAEPLPDKLK